MRNYFILLIMALLFTNCALAQFVGLKYINIDQANIVVTYSYRYQQDSTNPDKIRTSKMLLFLGNTISKFVNRANYIRDTATRRFTSADQVIGYMQNPQHPMAAQLFQIYKNSPNGKITVTDHIPGNAYKFEEKMDLFQWNLTGDTSTILGYKAQKAICNFGGRNWVAWFSPEIPFNDGPYKFNGLPGLIIKIHDTRNHHDFEILSINKLAHRVIIDIEDKEYIITTKQGFFRADDSFRDDIISRAKDAGMDNNTQQIVAKNMAERNNPIELIRK